MIKILFTALITFIATSIDEIPILFMLYTKSGNRGKGKIITSAYFVGIIYAGIGIYVMSECGTFEKIAIIF